MLIQLCLCATAVCSVPGVGDSMLANSKAKHLALNRWFLLQKQALGVVRLRGYPYAPLYSYTPHTFGCPPYIWTPSYVQIVLTGYLFCYIIKYFLL